MFIITIIKIALKSEMTVSVRIYFEYLMKFWQNHVYKLKQHSRKFTKFLFAIVYILHILWAHQRFRVIIYVWTRYFVYFPLPLLSLLYNK